jgi:hypothetical protein
VSLEVVASVVLGVVMLVAGGSKLASGSWPQQAANLHVDRRLAAVVPWIELVLGAGLITQLSPVVFAAGSIVLLGAFTVFLARLVSRGQRPPCACFGGRTPRPISWWSVARNIALIALALVIAAS